MFTLLGIIGVVAAVYYCAPKLGSFDFPAPPPKKPAAEKEKEKEKKHKK